MLVTDIMVSTEDAETLRGGFGPQVVTRLPSHPSVWSDARLHVWVCGVKHSRLEVIVNVVEQEIQGQISERGVKIVSTLSEGISPPTICM